MCPHPTEVLQLHVNVHVHAYIQSCGEHFRAFVSAFLLKGLPASKAFSLAASCSSKHCTKGCSSCTMCSHTPHVDSHTCMWVNSDTSPLSGPAFQSPQDIVWHLLFHVIGMLTRGCCRNTTVEAGPYVLPRAVQPMWDQMAEG